jgi:hypothetical protein
MSACSDTKRAKPIPGGPSGSGSGSQNGGDGDGDGGNEEPTIAGVVCEVSDPQYFFQCSTHHVPGIDVSLRNTTQTVLTAINGSFTLDSPGGDSVDLLTAFDFAGIRPSLHRIRLVEQGAANVKAPIIQNTRFNQLTSSAGVTQGDELAAILVYVVRTLDPMTNEPLAMAEPIEDVEITAPAGSAQPTFYENGGWQTGVNTGTSGAAAIFNVPTDIDIAEITVTLPPEFDIDPFTHALIPVAPDAVTFVIVDISQYE